MKAKNEKGSKGMKGSDTSQGLRDLFEDQLKDLYWAEKALTKSMPKVIKNATSQELIDALTYHVQLTVKQVKRLEDVFESLGTKAQAEKCEAMEGLIKEGEDIIDSTEEGVVRDAGIIAAVQKIEHYEIASYGTLKSFAEILGENEAVSLLEETLDEEKEADVKLTQIAESAINVEAAGYDEHEESEEESRSRTRSK